MKLRSVLMTALKKHITRVEISQAEWIDKFDQPQSHTIPEKRRFSTFATKPRFRKPLNEPIDHHNQG
jgi:predicted XRE-type DNA-binding protein